MTRVLVTGASGFIGRHVLERLAERGYDVHAVARRPLAMDRGGATWHSVDLLREADTEALVGTVRPAYLMHLAWYVEPSDYWTSPENVRWVEASLRLLRAFAAGGGMRAVLAGTCAEYEWGGSRYTEEESVLRPSTLYGASKLATSLVVEKFAELEGFSFATGRIFLTYGPGEPEDRLVPSIVRPLLEGRRAAATDGCQVRDFLHSADVASALVALLDSGVSGAVNIGSGQAVAVRDVVALAAAATGSPELVDYGVLPRNPEEPAELVATVGRLHEEVGWRPALSLEEGLAATVRWWRRRVSA